MIDLKEKKQELFEKINCSVPEYEAMSDNDINDLMKVVVKDRYHYLRELIFDLRASGVIESEKVYMHKIQSLIDEEKFLIEEIDVF
jgi:hypothetical protein